MSISNKPKFIFSPFMSGSLHAIVWPNRHVATVCLFKCFAIGRYPMPLHLRSLESSRTASPLHISPLLSSQQAQRAIVSECILPAHNWSLFRENSHNHDLHALEKQGRIAWESAGHRSGLLFPRFAAEKALFTYASPHAS